MKVYKNSITRIISNLVAILVVAIIASVIVGYFFGNMYGVIAGIVLALIIVKVNIVDARMRVWVDNEYLYVKTGIKLKSYHIPTSAIKATVTDGSATLYIDTEDGKSHCIDMDLLGELQFECLLEDMGVIGEAAPVTRLKTNKK